MKLYSILIFFFLTTVSTLWAQQEHRFSVALEWQAMQELGAEDEVLQRLYFENANYLDETNLPYFTYRIRTSYTRPIADYQVRLENIQYIACTVQEIKVLSQLEQSLPTELTTEQFISVEKKQPSVEILFSPIIQQGDTFVKVQQLDIVLTTTSTESSAKAGKRSLTESTSSLHQYATSSVLSEGNWYQMRVAQTGIYKLTYEELLNSGIQNPAKVRVYGYGGGILPEDFSVARIADDVPELALFMEKGADGIFNSGDYILFHAQGPIKWTFDETSGYYTHEQNYYSNYGYYFLTEGLDESKKITLQEPVLDVPTATVTDFLHYDMYEKDMVNLLESGREWYGDKLTSTNATLSIPFSFPSILASKTAKIEAVLAGNSTQTSTVTVSIDDTPQAGKITIFAISSYYQAARKGSGTYFANPKNTDNLNVQLTYTPQNNTAYAHLDYVRVNAYRNLRMQGNSLYFRQTNQDLRYEVLRYELTNSTPDIRIWELTDPLNMVEIPTMYANNTISFIAPLRTDAVVREFVALRTATAYPKPEVVGIIANQNLHAIQQADYVIISPKEFWEQANRLATYHQQKKGISTLIVEPQQIYNEFSSGTPDATAYRWLLKMLYDRAGDDVDAQPKALLFMGLSSYDNRGIVHNRMPLLSYQSLNSTVSTSSYTTDDYYAFLDDSEGQSISRDKMDVGVGRLPIATSAEGKIVVDKIMNYAANSKKGSWKNHIAFLGDDGDGNIHMTQSDNLVQIFQQHSGNYQPLKIYLDAYQMVQTASGSSYPTAKERILNVLKSGALIFNFVGHGSVNSLTEEQTIVRSDIDKMSNENLALWVTATCDFSRYDNNKTSAGMNVLLNSRGGGMALFTTTRTVFSGENYRLSQKIYSHIVPEDPFNPISLGEIMRKGKVEMGTDDNKLNFALLGDPMLSLTYPTNQVITTQINDEVLPDTATINALSLVSIAGYVENDNQTGIFDTFNGTIHVVVYDKEETLQTLSNRGNDPFTYTDRPNIIFSGTTSVVNGEFNVVFMVPKDINYRYGNGRIVYYAVDETQNREAHGHSEGLIVGGSNDDVIATDEGSIVRMYLNTPHFVSGQTVNNSPVFYAFINDDFGINTVGAGIGHDIVLTLHQQVNQTFVLNDYYQATLNDYKSGRIRYPLSNLAPGTYELQLKLWNLQNISTTQTLRFTVNDTAKPTIHSFYAYPNPASGSTTLVLEHDRPDVLTTATFHLYDLAGHLFWQSNSVTLLGDEPLVYPWNLTDGAGVRLQPGLYLIKVKIETPNESFTTATQKILILEQ
ncbi:MAG: type IX secretion system sortase PorU [Paludibacteraceae bacterium]|nr:type IX secretion system sortase PorU [Paludibacteraceae bacterium]MBP6284301.1 type IX secretion system sortase PorU [Paludibacteraceae bacterium]